MKKIYLVDVAVAEAIMAKSHVGSYTRGDGTFVAAHDDKRQAAAPKPAAGRAKAPKFDHPHVVGQADKTFQYQYEKGKGTSEKAVKPADAHHLEFLGKEYDHTFKSGQSIHDKKPVREFEHKESGHRVWLDDDGRVHADSQDEVEGLRKRYAAHKKAAK